MEDFLAVAGYPLIDQKDNAWIRVIGTHSNFGNVDISKDDIKSIFISGEVPFQIYIYKERKVYDQFNAEGTPQWILIIDKGKLYRSIFGSPDGA